MENSYKLGPAVRMIQIGETASHQCKCSECGQEWVEPFYKEYHTVPIDKPGTKPFIDRSTGQYYEDDPSTHLPTCSGYKFFK